MNEVKDITDQINVPVLVGLLETYIEEIDLRVEASIYEQEGVYSARYSHHHTMPPTDTPRTDLVQMKIIASDYLKHFKTIDVVEQEDY